MKVRLRIDSLAIEGLPLGAHQETALRAALESELANRFGQADGFGPSNAKRLTAIEAAFQSEAELLGRQIGAAIHRSIPRNAK